MGRANCGGADLEPQGVVAEVVFPNGLPFNIARFEDIGRAQRPELIAEGRRVHNRWLADFCAQAPERFAGLAVVGFDDVDACVADVEWAAEHGLRGIMMPALERGGRFFFEPELDPIWAACAATGLVVAQHGGTGSPAYPPGIASILTLPIEQSFFSGRSMWQMIWGGVFERHPTLRYALVETMIDWVPGVLRFMDGLAAGGEGWMAFAKMIGRGTPMITKLPSEFWATNCFAGSSPPARLEFAIRDELGVDRSCSASTIRISRPHGRRSRKPSGERSDIWVTPSRRAEGAHGEPGPCLRLRPRRAGG